MYKDFTSHNILKQCYKNINSYSTSSPHKIAHKLLAEWLIEKRHDRGEVATVGAEILFKNGFMADLVVYWRNDEVWTENIEVCNPMNYLHTIRYRGKKEFSNIMKELERKSIIDDRQATNIKKKRYRKRNNGNIHFYTDMPLEGLKAAKKVDSPPELRRKYEKWAGQTNELSFLLPEHEWELFEADIDKYDLELGRVYFIDKEDVLAFMDDNSPQQIHRGLGLLKIPKKLRDKTLISEKRI